MQIEEVDVQLSLNAGTDLVQVTGFQVLILHMIILLHYLVLLLQFCLLNHLHLLQWLKKQDSFSLTLGYGIYTLLGMWDPMVLN